jgi:hypothetical protein
MCVSLVTGFVRITLIFIVCIRRFRMMGAFDLGHLFCVPPLASSVFKISNLSPLAFGI